MWLRVITLPYRSGRFQLSEARSKRLEKWDAMLLYDGKVALDGGEPQRVAPPSPCFARSAKQRRASGAKFAEGELRAVGNSRGIGGAGALIRRAANYCEIRARGA